ncbi:PD-(D/E)XK nuclease family protein [Nitrosophilus labii]|uniref:PD-(D/E)XK nuclease family protein n=1 Tax=Nitrosophilus labii TaxID=2706014 RepID=UPI001FE2679B|nr:PD-(D/E)XK nuclease family protein [Nitrosophilus labii]
MVVNGWVALTTQDVAKYAETIINLNGGNEDMKKTRLELFIEKNLPKVLKDESLKTLGDRKKYVGSSDIGSCLRATYLNKINPDIKHDMATLIRFERGHIAEGITRKMLHGLPIQEQVEVTAAINGFKIKSHIDFLLENNGEAVIIEAKSVGSPITEAYNSWILQVQYQLHLLKINRDESKSIRAYIVAIDLNSGWFKTFEIAYNEKLAKLAIQRASVLVKAIKEGKEPEAEEQLYCSMCPHKMSCPLMESGVVEVQADLLQLAKEVARLEKEKKETEKVLKAKKAELEEFMRTAKVRKIKADEAFISLTSDTSYTSIDTKALKKERPALYEMLINKFGKEVTRKGYIQVK